MEYLLKASAIVTIFYFIYKVLLQRDTFFEFNRAFLLLGLIGSFIIPFLVIPIYIEYTPTPVTNYNFSNVTVVENTDFFDILDYLPIIYLAGVLFFSCRFIIQFVSLFTLILKNKSEKQGDFRHVKINTNVSPFSFFNWIVYNPNQFNKTELDQIITHEKVHVQQYHSVDILLTQLSCIVLWFSPFIWMYNKDVKQNLEFIADQKAQLKFNCKKSYQTTLLKTSMLSHQMALSNNFYNSLIKKRIIMLHKSKSKKINLVKYAFVIPLLALFFMSFNTEDIYVEKPYLNSENEAVIAQEISTKTDTEIFLIYNNFTDAKFKTFETELKSKGYDFNLKSIKRKTNNFITTIDFTITKNDTDGNYRIASGDAIHTIVIEYSKTKNKFSINTLNFIENEKRNTNNRNVVETIIDKNTAVASIENIKRLLKDKPLYILDGKEIKEDEFKALNPDNIETVNVLKGKKATEKYGDKGKNGVIEITTKKEQNEKFQISNIGGNRPPLYVLDGEEIKKEDIEKLDPNTFKSFNVLKGKKATKKYGDKGKNGVIEITIKQE